MHYKKNSFKILKFMINNKKLYLLLEIEKIRQNHKSIPTTFIYPLNGLFFTCCTYTLPGKVVYNVYKENIEDQWIPVFCNKKFNKDIEKTSNCLFDTLKIINDFIKDNEGVTIKGDITIWKISENNKEALNYLGECNKKINKKLLDFFETST